LTIELRPYQREAVDAIWEALMAKPNVLLQAATGMGKTVVFSSLIQRFLTSYPRMKIAVLAHRKELAQQAKAKLARVWPDSWFRVGNVCAGLGKVDTEPPVIIGTIQTLARRLVRRPVNLLIVDEIHRVAPIRDGNPSQYQTLIEGFRAVNPTMRLLGVTATAFRLNHGYIHGHDDDWFDCVDHDVPLDTLIEGGYLVPIRYRVVSGMEAELESVKLDNGEYKSGELSNLMCKEVHLESVAAAYGTYGEGRRGCCVFACTIAHAEALKAVLLAHGLRAVVVHSGQPDHERDGAIRGFNEGRSDFIVNVGILTEGWDSPRIDLVIMARPTMSPGLYVQMVGRGTRTSGGKRDLLVLDLVGNYLMHGPPGDPIVRDGSEPRVNAFKSCPKCLEPVPKGTDICPACGFKWEPASGDEAILVDKGARALVEVDVGAGPSGRRYRVVEWYARSHVSKKGNRMVRLTVECRPGGDVSTYLDFEGNAGAFAKARAVRFWRTLAAGDPPRSVSDAIARLDEIRIPEEVELVRDSNNYLKVKGW
jgi:DNA repair protein RadD